MKLPTGWGKIRVMDGREYIIPAPGTTFTIKEDCNVIEIDWSKAPEGATHYGPEDRTYVECWYKKCGEAWLFAAANSDWQWSEKKVSISPGRLRGIIPRRSQPWTGTGLPPVGTVCEFSHHMCDQGTGYVKFYGDEYCVIQNTTKGKEREQNGKICNYTFRPIKTKAQIEAEAVNQAIKEIAAIICRDGAFDIDDPEVAESAVALYDAGYRLTKQDGE